MKKLPERILSELDEAKMRAFYASCGISEATTEGAIKVWRNRTVEQDKKKLSLRSKKPKVAA